MSDPKKIGLVAARDFVATVGNKGFLFGLLVMPAMIGVMAVVVGPRIMNARSPQLSGDVAVMDPTMRVAAELRQTMAPTAIAARRAQNARSAISQAAPGAERNVASDEAIRRVVGQMPQLRLIDRPADGDVQREKNWLIPQSPAERHLALIVIHPDAIVRSDGRPEFGAYDLYVSRSMDENTESVIHESLRQALVSARLKASNLDQSLVETTMRVPRPASVIVSATGDRQSQRGFTRMLPLMLGVLMFVGIIIGGQGLMTSTVEEKSSRVVEVLLASVSPFELLAGKLVAQLGVGLLIIGIYVGVGIFGLLQFAMFGLLDPMLVVYLVVFFIISYLVYGALMMAIGAAVNQVAEAQSLMGPVMLMLMLPYILSPMIGRAPNSTFSIVVSFVPPVNTFAMLSRLASDAPPPAWQVWLTVVVGLGAACAAIWFAAKVFRIGLLMHGKPPTFGTLIRWARAA